MLAIYGIDAKSYLKRARFRLDENSLESLFYACLDLRCGIESRMREYLEPYDHIPKKIKNEWNLSKLDKACAKYFDTNQKKQRVTFIENGEIVAIIHYIPVSPKLIKAGQNLGNYLHDMKKFKASDDSWWIKFRASLEECYKMLDECCQGELVGPMLKQDNKITQVMNISGNDSAKFWKQMIGKTGTMKFEYI